MSSPSKCIKFETVTILKDENRTGKAIYVRRAQKQFEKMTTHYYQKERPEAQKEINDKFHMKKALQHLHKISVAKKKAQGIILEQIKVKLQGLIELESGSGERQGCDYEVDADSDENDFVDGSRDMTTDDNEEYLDDALSPSESTNINCDLAEHSYVVKQDFYDKDLRFTKREKVKTQIHKCQVCTRLFISQEGLNNHMDRDHELETVEKCEYCSETFKFRYLLNKHVESEHQEPLICEICGKKFKSKRRYTTHKLAHGKSSKLQCPHCDVVISSGSMTRHINSVHKKLKPFKW